MQKPAKTFADYLVTAISPILIMALVGSLAFFLIQVFYRGEMVRGIRWLVFWFVFAIVLVSRLGIEQSKGHARFYGAALAIATWIYLAHTHTAPVPGLMLLAITWWCAHKLTMDCTLINDDEDASGEGVLQGLWRKLELAVVPPAPLRPKPPLTPLELLAAADLANRRMRAPPRTPGRWVIYFSLAALPLFGVGQLLLPNDDPAARRTGFVFLAVYLGAALSLLITTSFLGLRRYLRQRSVEMPASIAFGWIRFGVFLAGGVLLLALVLPRPGATNTWRNLTHNVDHKEHKASDHALPFNPPGEGEGAPGNHPNERNQPGVDSKKAAPGNGSQTSQNPERSQPNARNQPAQPGRSDGGGQPGDYGQPGQGGQPGDRAPSRQPRQLKDTDSSGDSSQSSDRGRTGGSGGTGEPEGDGADRQPGNGAQSGGPGQPGKDPQGAEPRERRPPASQPKPVDQPAPEQPENSTQVPKPPSKIHLLLRALLIIAFVALFIWLVIRYRKVLAQGIRSIIAAVREFFRKLFSLRRRQPPATAGVPPPAPVLEPFAAYENPFVTGKDRTWPPERLLFYTYEAVQAWSKEQGIEIEPQQTPREFCARLGERFPDFGPELERFSFFYSHAAFAKELPDDFESEPIRRLWQYLGDSVMAVASR